jgi:hypothetical protein
VLATNPIPPASSDNSLSASFRPLLLSLLRHPRPRPPRSPRAALRDSTLLPGGRSSVSTYPRLPIRPTCSRYHFGKYIRGEKERERERERERDQLSFTLYFVVSRRRGSGGVAFSNFLYAPTNLRFYRGDGRRWRLRWNGERGREGERHDRA